MRNNIQNDVKIEEASVHSTKKDLSGSVNSTYQIGRVGVCTSRFLLPDSKTMASPESLVQTAPLVSPCYAKQYYRQWHMFVPIEDVFKNYSALMTGKEISRNGVIISPTRMPFARAKYISTFCLNGAKCTMWFKQLNKLGAAVEDDGKPTGEFFSGRDLDEQIEVDAVSGVTASVALSALVDAAKLALLWQPDSDGVPTVNFSSLNDVDYTLTSGNLVESTFVLPSLDVDESATDEMGYDYNSFSTPESADFVYYKTFDVEFPSAGIADNIVVKYRCAYCFRLSTWGAELFKVLKGLGFSTDPDDTSDYSILPLVATFKAYWDIFGLNLWQNYESTRAGMLQTYYDNKASVNIESDSTARPLFYQFMRDELAQMWVTEKNDYISAHLPQPVVGAPNETPLFGIADMQDADGALVGVNVAIYAGDDYNTPTSGQPSIALEDGHAKTRRVTHGALDSELLKRMYKATNTQTQFGQLLVAQMRTQGLGTYLERTRTNYIGDFKVVLDVSGVTATSDTYQSATKDGRPLGSRAGKCVGYGKVNKKLWYRTDCAGWWIVFDAITCDSGWAQGVDLTNKVTKREEMYQPLYDGAGMKINNADVLIGHKDISLADFANNISEANRSPSKHPWGYMTRFAEFKVGRNTENGGFALKSRRNYFLTYDMNKLIFLDNLSVFENTNKSTESVKYLRVARGVSLEDLPIAGNPYRFLARYPWLSNLGRIFADVGRSLPSFMFTGSALEFLRKAWEYVFLNDDNYIVQTDLWFKTWNTAIPIEDTYGTVDPEEKDNLYMEKV